jgi:hypothetical protein
MVLQRALIGFAVLVLLAAPAAASEIHISGCLDWMVGSRVGLEYYIDPGFAWKADIGFQPFGLVTADAFGVIGLLPYGHRYRVNLLVGIPFAGMPAGYPGGLVSFGGAIEVGWWANHRVSLNLRIGAGFPLFFEKDADVIRDTQFPLNLWPDLAFSLTVRL